MEILFFLLGLTFGVLFMYLFYKNKINTLNEINKQIDNQIKTVINNSVIDAMNSNSQILVRLINELLEKYKQNQELLIEKQKNKFTELIFPLKENIEKYQNLVEKFAHYNTEHFGKYSEQLNQILKLEKELRKQTQNLSNALKSPTIRGKWAEIQLKRLFELTGMTKYIDFNEQKTTETSKQKPDFIVNLPDNKKLIIDSKLPLTNFLKSIETENEALQAEYLKKFIADFKKHINELYKREYWKKFENNIEFVIMYVHIENALTKALSLDNDLINYALEKRIIIATPFTLMALLQTFAFIWKQTNINENAKQILQIAQQFGNNLEIVLSEIEKLGNHLQTALKKYEEINIVWNKKISPLLKNLSDMGFVIDKQKIKK